MAPRWPAESSPPLARVTLHEYALEWIGRYQGTGRRGFREETRDEYRAHLEKYTLRYFPPQTRLSEIDPRMVADFIGWLVKQPNRSKGDARRLVRAQRLQAAGRLSGDRQARGADPPQPGGRGDAAAPAADRGGRGGAPAALAERSSRRSLRSSTPTTG